MADSSIGVRLRRPAARFCMRTAYVGAKPKKNQSFLCQLFDLQNSLPALVCRSMRNVTLRQLRVFEAVARHMNFSRAAEELHLSQPAVSTQIKELAAHVGLPLFARLARQT